MVPLKSDYWFWDYHLEPKLLLQVLGCVCFSSVTKPWCMYGLVIPTTFQFRIRNPPYWVLTNDYVACLKVCTSLSRELHKSPIFILFTGTVKPLKEVPLYVLTKFHQVIKLLDDCLKDKLQFPSVSVSGTNCPNNWKQIHTFSLFSGSGVVRMEKTCPKTRASSSVGRLPKK